MEDAAATSATMASMANVLKGNEKALGAHDITAGRVPVTPLLARRFSIDAERQELLRHLEEEGYAVVAEVADAEAVGRAKSLMWDFLEALPNTGVRRGDVRTWGNPADWIPSPTNGIINGFGFGQSDFMWFLRLLPRVKAAFEAIWRTEDLLVSFDGGNAFRPWRYDASWLTRGGWYHMDQNATRPGSIGRVCVQGLVTLTDVTADTGGLVVVPRSHRHHGELCKRSGIPPGIHDFVMVRSDDPVLSEGAKLVCARAGDLLLWDSRTVHCNTPALTALVPRPQVGHASGPAAAGALQPEGVDGTWELLRQAGYVCMTPAAWAPDSVLRERQEAFVHGISTSHWPHKFVVAGRALPDTPLRDLDSLGPAQRALIGCDRPRRSCAVL